MAVGGFRPPCLLGLIKVNLFNKNRSLRLLLCWVLLLYNLTRKPSSMSQSASGTVNHESGHAVYGLEVFLTDRSRKSAGSIFDLQKTQC